MCWLCSSTTKNGLPNNHAFEANSFSELEEMFRTKVVANYAYVYEIQPLKEGLSSFCVACIGTDNKFTAEEVLNYIYNELSLRGIYLICFAADGDSA